MIYITQVINYLIMQINDVRNNNRIYNKNNFNFPYLSEKNIWVKNVKMLIIILGNNTSPWNLLLLNL